MFKAFEKQLDSLIDEYMNMPKHMKPLENSRRHNILILGPENSGIRQLNKYFSQKTHRGVISMADIIEWNQ